MYSQLGHEINEETVGTEDCINHPICGHQERLDVGITCTSSGRLRGDVWVDGRHGRDSFSGRGN